MSPLTHIQSELTSLLKDGIGETIKALQDCLVSDSPFRRDVFILEARLAEANKHRLQGILSDEDLQLTYNKIRVSLLELIEALTSEDVKADVQFQEAPSSPTANQGQILYQIPGQMALKEEKKCVIRIAFDVDTIVTNIELTNDAKLAPIRISELMQVELLSDTSEEVFHIRTISTTEQFVEKHAYTEWIFYVTPFKAGVHHLLLKVSVIELIYGKERKREIILEEKIEVITASEEKVQEDARFKALKDAFTFQHSPRSQSFDPARNESADSIFPDQSYAEHAPKAEASRRSKKSPSEPGSSSSTSTNNTPIPLPTPLDSIPPPRGDEQLFPYPPQATESTPKSQGGIFTKAIFGMFVLAVSSYLLWITLGTETNKPAPDKPKPGLVDQEDMNPYRNRKSEDSTANLKEMNFWLEGIDLPDTAIVNSSSWEKYQHLPPYLYPSPISQKDSIYQGRTYSPVNNFTYSGKTHGYVVSKDSVVAPQYIFYPDSTSIYLRGDSIL